MNFLIVPKRFLFSSNSVFQEYLTCKQHHIARLCDANTRRLADLLVASVRDRHSSLCQPLHELDLCKELQLDSGLKSIDPNDHGYDHKTSNANFDQLNPLKVQRLPSQLPPPLTSGQSYTSLSIDLLSVTLTLMTNLSFISCFSNRFWSQKSKLVSE